MDDTGGVPFGNVEIHRVCGDVTKPRGSFEAVEVDGDVRLNFFDLPFDELRALRSSLLETLSGEPTSLDQVAQAVDPHSRLVGDWLRDQDNRMELLTAVSVLLALISIYMSWRQAHNSAPPQTVINQTIINVETGKPAEIPLPPGEPCFCDSGKQFGECHGLPDR